MNIKLHNLKLILCCFGMLVAACRKPEVKVPEDVLSADSMVLVLVDVHLSEAALAQKNLMGESTTKSASAYYGYVFNKYKITSDRYQKSVSFYAAHPVLYEKIYQNVITELSRQQATSMDRNKE